MPVLLHLSFPSPSACKGYILLSLNEVRKPKSISPKKDRCVGAWLRELELRDFITTVTFLSLNTIMMTLDEMLLDCIYYR